LTLGPFNAGPLIGDVPTRFKGIFFDESPGVEYLAPSVGGVLLFHRKDLVVGFREHRAYFVKLS
jgi:hypothetical protein